MADSHPGALVQISLGNHRYLVGAPLAEELDRLRIDLAATTARLAVANAALQDIAGSGPVNARGEHDPDAGWSWCYERASAALSASRSHPAALERLAACGKEVGANLPAADGWPPNVDLVMDLFLRRLVSAIRAASSDGRWDPGIAYFLLDHLLDEHEAVDRVISYIDDDDGWPECRVLHAIKGIHCALEFTDRHSRWLAQAALHVAALTGLRAHQEQRAWVARELEATIREATPHE